MTDTYTYYNRNPNGLKLNDCVCKAISTATDLKYDAVNKLLSITAQNNNCDKLCVCCYNKLLSGTLCYDRYDCDFECTVMEVVSKYPNNTLIIRIRQHLTSSINGKLLDIWDCSNKLVDCYWIIK